MNATTKHFQLSRAVKDNIAAQMKIVPKHAADQFVPCVVWVSDACSVMDQGGIETTLYHRDDAPEGTIISASGVEIIWMIPGNIYDPPDHFLLHFDGVTYDVIEL